MFVASARQLAKALEVPLVNDLGYTKRYVRCLQISEVVNSMKDLIDYSRETGAGPMESLAKFPRNSNSLPEFQNQSDGQLQQKRPQTAGQNSNGDNSVQAAAMQLTSTMSTPSVNNAVSSVPASSTSTIVGLLHQNSMNSRQQNPMASPYGGNSMQMPSPGSSNTPLPASHTSISAGHVTSVVNSPNVSMQQPAMSGDAEANDSQSSVQKIIHDMIMSPQFGAGGMMGMSTMGGEVKNINGMLTSGTNGVLVGSGVGNGNNPGISGSIGNGRAGLGHNSLSMNGRIGMTMGREQQQQDVSNQLLNGLDGFNSFQFDWKSSP